MNFKLFHKVLNCSIKASSKQLKDEYKGFWRIRTGDYRVVYKIMQKDVVILAVGHRKEVYKDITLLQNKKK